MAAEKLYSEFYEWRLRDSPEFATMMGIHKYDDQLESYTLKSFEQRRETVNSLLQRAEMLIKENDDSNLDLFIEMLQGYLDGYDRTKSFVFPLSRIEGVHVDLVQTISYMKFENDADFKKYAKRLSELPKQIDGIIEIMKFGIENKLTLHSISLKNVPADIQTLIETDNDKSLFYKPIKSFTGQLTEETTAAVDRAIQSAKQGLQALSEFIQNVYLPKCRPDIAITSVGGKAYYEQCLKFHLGYEASAEEVHNLGIQEVERITSDIKKVIADLGLTDTPKEFAERMRHNDKFLFKDQNEIKAYYEKLLKERIQPQLSKFFRKLPQAQLRLELVDKNRSAGPVAYYIQGSSDGTRPGTFYINGNDPHRSPKHILPALALHEANPGHHLQGSRLLETPGLASFRLMMEDRRYTDMPTHFPIHTAYTEGWGLYSEYLGHEMGVYLDANERYGHYSQEMLRACRLVVDTGMHALGWSRDKAINYLLDNLSSSLSEIESEIDRYITWPGQACGYKIGEIRLKQLREKATKALGNKFDIRDFHEVVMNNVGTMTFLEKAVNKYIQENI